jgi:DNA-binding Lrp family transcriptional regulator
MKMAKVVVALLILMTVSFGSFFYFQNKEDIQHTLAYKERFEFENVAKRCERVQGSYFECFIQDFQDYLKKVSLTGMNFGMHFIFETIKQDKEQNDFYKSQDEKNIVYSFYHLELNNLVLENAINNYKGIEELYGAYISALDDFLPKAYQFSDNIIVGLKSASGIATLDKEKQKRYFEKLDRVIEEYNSLKRNNDLFLKTEAKKLKERFSLD